MQNTPSLQSLRERVSSAQSFLEAKKILNNILVEYALSDDYLQSGDAHRGRAMYLFVLFSDLLDDLFIHTIQTSHENATVN